jgi:hypothetical protein
MAAAFAATPLAAAGPGGTTRQGRAPQLATPQAVARSGAPRPGIYMSSCFNLSLSLSLSLLFSLSSLFSLFSLLSIYLHAILLQPPLLLLEALPRHLPVLLKETPLHHSRDH